MNKINLDKIEDAIKSFKNGEIIIVVDDENRENEVILLLLLKQLTQRRLILWLNTEEV